MRIKNTTNTYSLIYHSSNAKLPLLQVMQYPKVLQITKTQTKRTQAICWKQ